MESKQIIDFLTYKFDVFENKFDKMKHEIKQEINKINDRLEIIVTKVTELVIILDPTSHIPPKPTFDDEILRLIELYEINNNDLIDEEELMKELGIFGIGANKPSSPNLSISTSIHQVAELVQELQFIQSMNSNLLVQSFPVKYDKSMVMVATFRQLGTQ